MMAGVVICAASASGNAFAQDASPADKQKSVLETNKKGVLDATRGLSEAQWNFKAAPDKWSVAECAEHIAAAEDFILGIVVQGRAGPRHRQDRCRYFGHGA
jgi:DinB superfamily